MQSPAAAPTQTSAFVRAINQHVLRKTTEGTLAYNRRLLENVRKTPPPTSTSSSSSATIKSGTPNVTLARPNGLLGASALGNGSAASVRRSNPPDKDDLGTVIFEGFLFERGKFGRRITARVFGCPDKRVRTDRGDRLMYVSTGQEGDHLFLGPFTNANEPRDPDGLNRVSITSESLGGGNTTPEWHLVTPEVISRVSFPILGQAQFRNFPSPTPSPAVLVVIGARDLWLDRTMLQSGSKPNEWILKCPKPDLSRLVLKPTRKRAKKPQDPAKCHPSQSDSDTEVEQDVTPTRVESNVTSTRPPEIPDRLDFYDSILSPPPPNKLKS